MATKRTPLTQQQYDQIAQSSDWKIVELHPTTVSTIPGVQRKDAIIGVFASGDVTTTKHLNDHPAILGMDVICHEANPRTDQKEGPINVYHYIVTKTGNTNLPYCLHGRFLEETLIGHWPLELDLTVYGVN